MNFPWHTWKRTFIFMSVIMCKGYPGSHFASLGSLFSVIKAVLLWLHCVKSMSISRHESEMINYCSHVNLFYFCCLCTNCATSISCNVEQLHIICKPLNILCEIFAVCNCNNLVTTDVTLTDIFNDGQCSLLICHTVIAILARLSYE